MKPGMPFGRYAAGFGLAIIDDPTPAPTLFGGAKIRVTFNPDAPLLVIAVSGAIGSDEAAVEKCKKAGIKAHKIITQ